MADIIQQETKIINSTSGGRISARRAVGTSLVVDVIDILLNAGAALFTGSVVMLAEVLQGLADFTADTFLWIGVKRAQNPADKKHPFGYGREIYIWTMFASLVMLVALAGLTLYFGWQRLINPQAIEHTFVAFTVLIISVISNTYSFSVSFRRIYQDNYAKLWHKYLSSPLVETKTTMTLDLLGTLSALTGLSAIALYYFTGELRFDGLGALFIGTFMVVFALIIFVSAKDFLVGKAASPEIIQKIHQSALIAPQVAEVLDIRATSIGLHRYLVQLDINARDNLTTDDLEELTQNIEKNIRAAVPEALFIQVEFKDADTNENDKG